MRSRITSRAESWSAKALGRTWIACATPPSRWLQSLPEAKSDRSSGSLPALPAHEDLPAEARRAKAGGAEGNRTPDLCSAIAALSHLSYSPAPFRRPGFPARRRAGRRPDSEPAPLSQCANCRGFVSTAALNAPPRAAERPPPPSRSPCSPPARMVCAGMAGRDHTQESIMGYGSDDRFDNRWRDRSGYGRGEGRGGYGRDDDDRGFFERAGDEVRSWFGDDDAQRRREMDERRWEQEQRMTGRRDNDPRSGGSGWMGGGWGNQRGESWNREPPGERGWAGGPARGEREGWFSSS